MSWTLAGVLQIESGKPSVATNRWQLGSCGPSRTFARRSRECRGTPRLDGLHTLAVSDVHDGRTRVRVPVHLLVLEPVQRNVEEVAGAVEAKTAKLVVYRLPGRETRGRWRQAQPVRTTEKI